MMKAQKLLDDFTLVGIPLFLRKLKDVLQLFPKMSTICLRLSFQIPWTLENRSCRKHVAGHYRPAMLCTKQAGSVGARRWFVSLKYGILRAFSMLLASLQKKFQ